MKILKNKFIFMLCSAVLALGITFAGIFANVNKISARADGTPTIDATWTVSDPSADDLLPGKYLYLYNPDYKAIFLELNVKFAFEERILKLYVTPNGEDTLPPSILIPTVYPEDPVLTELGLNEDGAIYYLPESLEESMVEIVEGSYDTFWQVQTYSYGFTNYDGNAPVIVKFLSAPTSAPVDEPTPDPETPGENNDSTGSSSTGIGADIREGADKVADWANENLGLTITGSTVITVGIIIAIVLLLRRK